MSFFSDIINKLKQYGQQTSSFVRQNPTPINYIQRQAPQIQQQVQQRVVQPVKQAWQQPNVQSVWNNPATQVIRGITSPELSITKQRLLGGLKAINTASGIAQRINPMSLIPAVRNQNQQALSASRALVNRNAPTNLAGKTANFVGEQVPYLAIPMGGETKAATVAGRVGLNVAKNALIGGAFGASQPFSEGKGAKEVLKGAGIGAAAGAGLGLATEGVGALAGKVGSLIKEKQAIMEIANPQERQVALDSFNARMNPKLKAFAKLSTPPLSNEAKSMMTTAKERLGNFDENKVVAQAKKIADIEGNKTIQPNHLAEALQYVKSDGSHNTANIGQLFGDQKGWVKDFSGSTVYDRMKQVGATENLDTTFPALYKKATEKISTLDTEPKQLLQMWSENYNGGEKLGSQQLEKLSSVIDDAQKIAGKNKVTNKEIALALQKNDRLLSPQSTQGAISTPPLSNEARANIDQVTKQSPIEQGLTPNISTPKTLPSENPSLVNTSLSKPIPPTTPNVNDVTSALQGNQVKPRGFTASIQSADKTPQVVKDMLSGQYTVKSDKQLAQDAATLIHTDPVSAANIAIHPRNDTEITIGNKLLDHYLSTGEFDKFNQLQAGMAQAGTELGRATRAFGQYSKTEPTGIIRYTQSMINKFNQANPTKAISTDLTPFLERAKQIQGMVQGRDRAIATQQLMRDTSRLLPSSLSDKIGAFFRASVISGPRTIGKIALSYGMNTPLQAIKTPIVAGADFLRSALTGADRETALTGRGIISGAKGGISAGYDLLKSGYENPNYISNPRNPMQGVHFQTKWIQTLVDLPGKLHEAISMPIYGMTHENSLASMAKAKSINLGLKGSEATQYINDFMKNPDMNIAQLAKDAADKMTFMDKTTLGDIAGKTSKAINKGSHSPVGTFLMPVTKKPGSIFGAAARMIPGYENIKSLADYVTKDKATVGGFSKLIDRQAGTLLGGSLMALGAHLLAKGQINLDAPLASSKEGAQWQLENRRANTIKIGNSWINISALGPIGMLIATGAYGARGWNQGQDLTSKIIGAVGQGGAGFGKEFLQMPMIQGVSQVENMITSAGNIDPNNPNLNQYKQFLGNMLGGLVPAVSENIASAFDKIPVREKNSLLDFVKYRIPGLRETLTPTRNVAGQTIPQSNENPLLKIFDPTQPTQQITDSVTSELNRLQSKATPTKLTPKINIGGTDINLNPTQLNQLEQTVGPQIFNVFGQVMLTPDYQKADDKGKATILNSITDQLRTNAKLIQTVQSNQVSPTDVNNEVSKMSKNQKTLLTTGQVIPSTPSTTTPKTLGAGQVQNLMSAIQSGNMSGVNLATAGTDLASTYALNSAKLTSFKDKKDINSWMKTANDQLDNINKQLADPTLSETDQLKLQHDGTVLANDMAKYAGYGGFTKGKSGKAKVAAIKSALKSAGVSKITGKVSSPKMTIKSVGKVGTPVVKKPTVGGLNGKIRARVASGASGAGKGSTGKIGRLKRGTGIRA